MSLPAKVKTWQHTVNTAKGNSGVLLTDARAVMRQLKTAMIGFGSAPWTVSGSSNSSASGMDAVDRWSADTDLVWASGAHSWIVLRQTGIAAKFEVCIDLSNASQNSITVAVSGSVGFGTVNGGTNGTTSARPTATDEVVIINNTTWWGSPAATAQHYVHVMQSTDGQCTRLLVTTSQVAHMIVFFEKPRNPISPWSVPWFAGWRGTGSVATSAASFTQWNDNALASFKPQGTDTGALYYATTFGNGGVAMGQRQTVAQDLDGAHIFTPITLVADTIGLRGVWGEVFDLYFSDTGMVKATQFDSSPSHAWTFFQELVLPWDELTAVSS